MPAEFAARAAAVVARGYNALKFDPFTTAWKMLDGEEEHAAIEIIDAVARAVGPKVGLMIEIHGRLAAGEAIRFIHRLASHNIVWCEEPVAPENLDLLKEVKASVQYPIAAGERLYTLADFARMITMRACDVVQMDIAHCGGLIAAKKTAALAAVQDIGGSPDCSIGPGGVAAAIPLAYPTPHMPWQEYFAEVGLDGANALAGRW